MPKSPNRDWIADKLALLTEHADELVEVEPSVTNSYRPLTALKLIVLSAGVEVFSRIVPQRYEHNYYLDLFAGAGATTLRGIEDTAVVGSPILAPVMSHQDFEGYHFVELSEKKADALEARLDYMDSVIDFPREKCHVHFSDANDYAHEFLENFRAKNGGYEGFNMFSFIDPEGMDPRWDVIRRIADLYGDLLIHYPETTINRDMDTQKASSYFPDDSFRKCRTEEERKQVYSNGLESRDNTDISIPIRIDSGESGKNYHYDLIYATRETPGGAPYAAAMEAMQHKMKRLDGDDIRRVLRSLQGDEKALDNFISTTTETENDSGHHDLNSF